MRIKNVILSLILICGSVFGATFYVLSASAGTFGNTDAEYSMRFGVDSNPSWVTYMTVDNIYQWSSDSDTFFSNSGQYSLYIVLRPNEALGNRSIGIRAGGDVSNLFHATLQQGSDEGGYIFTASFDAREYEGNRLSLNPYIEDNNNSPTTPLEGQETAIIRLKGTDNDCVDEYRPDEETGEMVEILKDCNDTYQDFGISFNPPATFGPKPEGEGRVHEEGTGNFLYDEFEVNYYPDPDNQDTINLKLSTLWHEKFVRNITINGHSYPVDELIDYDDQEDWLTHYEGQTVSIDLTVDKPEDNIYNIEADISKNPVHHIGNFLWTSDPDQEFERNPETGEYLLDEDGEKIRGHDYIGHSTLALVAISFDLYESNYYCNVDDDSCVITDLTDEEAEPTICSISAGECEIPFVEYDHDEGSEFEEGSLVIPAGARITMRVIPDYGYQVLNVNMADLEVNDDGVGEFTFTVPGGAAYFMADVVEMDNEVTIDSKKISSGAIDLGDQTTLSQGTARLEVSDVELSEENKGKFVNLALGEGYDVKNYLNISLSNIVYQGNEENAWEDEVHELNEPATITLQLEEGIDGNEIVILHEKDDGTYEIIETTYDPAARTISFKTSSFSNYAIASRTVSTPNTGLFTKTMNGSNQTLITTSIIVIVISAIGFATVYRKKLSN